MRAGKDVFGADAAGSPFIIYAYGKEVKVRNYALVAGDQLMDAIPIDDFADGRYDLRVYGPNGFYRAFTGNRNDPAVAVSLDYEQAGGNGTSGSANAVVVGSALAGAQKLSGRIRVHLTNGDNTPSSIAVEIRDNYSKAAGGDTLHPLSGKSGSPNEKGVILLDPASRYGWYDFTVTYGGHEPVEKRYAGRVETGKESFSDPAMG